MCTIIDKHFESPVWQKQIQKLNLQTSSVPNSPTAVLIFFSPEPTLINNYKHQCKQTQILNLLSLHFFNLFPLYPYHPSSINNFPDWCSAFPYTNSKSLQDVYLPLPPSTLLHSSIAFSNTSVGSEESRQDRSWQQAWQAARSIKCLQGGREAWCVGERRERSRGTGVGPRSNQWFHCINKNTIDLTIPLIIAIKQSWTCF